MKRKTHAQTDKHNNIIVEPKLSISDCSEDQEVIEWRERPHMYLVSENIVIKIFCGIIKKTQYHTCGTVLKSRKKPQYHTCETVLKSWKKPQYHTCGRVLKIMKKATIPHLRNSSKI